MADIEIFTSQNQDVPSNTARDFLRTCHEKLTYAYQPIVETHTGVTFGYEALLRNHQALGVETISDLFDKAAELGILHRFDVMIRAKAIGCFANLDRPSNSKLFFNIDNRTISSKDYAPGLTKRILDETGLPASSLCFEISERHEVSMAMAEGTLKHFKDEAYTTAIDDFGTGYSGLKLLQDHTPDFLKVDRHFIKEIYKDKKRKLLVSSIIDLAHVLGIFVVAEGVETQEDFMACKDLDFNLVQGFYISHPQNDPQKLKKSYPHIVNINRREQNKKNAETRLIVDQMEYLPPLRIDDPMNTVFEAFRRNKNLTFFPVVDEHGYPLGIIQENRIKDYTYSPYGKDLINNPGAGINLRRFIDNCPVADIHEKTKTILENFSHSESPEGIIIVKSFSYMGFLSAASLLRVINEHNIAQARDSNPLTKLPGNASIASYVNERLEDCTGATTLAYLDLDNFKAFNDTYGFRQGDRAIILFADLMRKRFKDANIFLAHIGGDDFFIGATDYDFALFQKTITTLLDDFSNDVESFYDATARDQKCIRAKDRHGVMRDFSLMTCSAALIHMSANRKEGLPDAQRLDQDIADLKKTAKTDAHHMAIKYY